MIDIQKLQSNIDQVKSEIADAARQSGRSVEEITLVAVTKYVDSDTTRLFPQCGVNTLGESRPQALWEKAESLRDEQIQWHMIGHLQRNKVARTIECASIIHSIDSLRLLKEIDRDANRANTSVRGLLQVNISHEQNKHGFGADELRLLIEQLDQYPHVKIEGLMGMAGLDADDTETQRQFASLRILRDELLETFPQIPNSVLKHLSMGMSHDFHLAIKEGATIVRIGSRFFE